MKISANIMEKSMEGLQTIFKKHLDCHYREYIQRKNFGESITPICIAVLITIVPKWKKPQYP
jgi:hypothetical protein